MTEEKMVKKTFMFSEVEVNRFKSKHPGHGDLVEFLRTALKRYNDLNDTDRDELIGLAIGEIQLDDEEK